MIKTGKINKLKVERSVSIGYYLTDDILLPTGSITQDILVGSYIDVFIYRDSKDRLIATMKMPIAMVGDLKRLKLKEMTKIGAFVSIGLERDVLVPFKEIGYPLEEDKEYLFYIYLDRSDRLCATSKIDKHLMPPDGLEVSKEYDAYVYDVHSNGNILCAISDKYKGIILKNEVFIEIKQGTTVKATIKKIHENEIALLSVRKKGKDERIELQDIILEYLRSKGGTMKLNDNSSPEDIKKAFNTSKNYFKNALGGLMKRGLIIQDENGCKLIKERKMD